MLFTGTEENTKLSSNVLFSARVSYRASDAIKCEQTCYETSDGVIKIIS